MRRLLITLLLFSTTVVAFSQPLESEIKADVFPLGDEVWVNGDVYSGDDLLYGVELRIAVIDPDGDVFLNTMFTAKTEEERSGSDARKRLGFELPILDLNEAQNGTWVVWIHFDGDEAYVPSSFETEIVLPVETIVSPEPSPVEPEPEPTEQTNGGGIPGFPLPVIALALMLFRILRRSKQVSLDSNSSRIR